MPATTLQVAVSGSGFVFFGTQIGKVYAAGSFFTWLTHNSANNNASAYRALPSVYESENVPYGTPYTTGYRDRPGNRHNVLTDKAQLRPKYHSPPMLATPHSSLSYNPPAIAQRTEYDATKAMPTFNNLAGSEGSIHVYSDPAEIKKDLIEGAYTPNEWGARPDSTDKFHHLPHTQITAEKLLMGAREPYLMARWMAKQYKLKGADRFLPGRPGMHRIRTDMQPGWRIDELDQTICFASLMKTAANVKVTIVPYKAQIRGKNLDYPAQEKGYAVLCNHNTSDNYKVKHPGPVASPHQETDTLGHSGDFAAQIPRTSNLLSSAAAPMMHYNTLQLAISVVESMGLDWEVKNTFSNAWPAARHKLYTSNFPYRGLTKAAAVKPDPKYIRQKGGDSPRVREVHPHTIDHFQDVSNDQLFAM